MGGYANKHSVKLHEYTQREILYAGRINIFWGGFVVRYITTNLGHDLDVIKHFSVSPKKKRLEWNFVKRRMSPKNELSTAHILSA